MPKPTVITVMNQKGGVGKTTLVGMLAGEYAAMGFEVALIDLDPQRSLVEWLTAGTVGALRDSVLALEYAPDHPDPKRRAFPTQRLRDAVEVARKQGNIDYLLIDTPPQLNSAAALTAASLADLVLIPVQPSALDVRATMKAMASVVEAVGESGRVALVPSMVNPRTTAAKDLPALLAQKGMPVLPAIGLRQAVADVTVSGGTLAEVSPRSAARADFAALAAAVNKMLRKGAKK